MNEKIKQLAIRAGLTCTQDGWVSTQKKHAEGVEDEYLERFAELVRADEREACAQLCDEASLYFEYDRASPEYSADYCAKAIRARGKK